MTVAVSTLLSHVRDLVNEHHRWFDAVAAWYDHDLWSKRRFIEHLAARDQPVGQATLMVNDLRVEERHRDPDTPAAVALWWVPTALLQAGDNLLYLRLQPSGTQPIAIDGISVQHIAGLTEDSKHRHRPLLRPTTQAAVAVNLGLGFRPEVDRWTVEAREKSVRINVYFEGAPPVNFVAAVLVRMPTVGYSLLLEDLWDLVTDAVKDRLKDKLRDYYRRLAKSDPSAAWLEQEIHLLRSYLELHERHLARMLPLGDDVTLQQVIEQARKPAATVEKSPPRVDRPEPRPAPRAEPAPPRPAPAPARTHWFIRLMVASIALAVTAVAVLAVAWKTGLIDEGDLANLSRKLTPQPALPQLALPQPALPLPAAQPPIEQKRGMIDQLAAKQAKTGDVQVSLHWNNKNDLDLEVLAPTGELLDLSYQGRASKSGGRFDFDMNVVYDAAVANPVENVYWPIGQAPKGRYQVFVTHFRNHGRPDCQDPTRFTVRVVARGQEQWAHGEVVHADPNRRRVRAYEFEVR